MPATSSGVGSGVRAQHGANRARVARAQPEQRVERGLGPARRRGFGDGGEAELVLAAQRRDLAQQRVALEVAGVGERDLRGVVDHVHVVEADAAGEQALLERLDVAAVQRRDSASAAARPRPASAKMQRLRATRARRASTSATTALPTSAPDLVDRDVDDGLDAPLLGLGHGRVEQLVGRAEERVGERLVGAAGEGGGLEAGHEAPRERARRGEQRAQRQRARDPELAQRGAAERRLQQQARHAHRGVEGGEGAQQAGARAEALARLRLELEVDERLGDGAEEHDERDVAQVRVAQQDGGRDRRGRLRRRRERGRWLAASACVRRSAAAASSAEHDQQQDAAPSGSSWRREPGERAARHPAGGGAGADAADDLARGVGVEALVDQRPEAGDERAAEGGDVDVEEQRGGRGPDEAERVPDAEQQRGERRLRRGRRAPASAVRARPRAARRRRARRARRLPSRAAAT